MTRYSRQELYVRIGKEGQKKIRKTVIAIVGVGAIGSVSAELLSRAGIGRLILIDRDFVEESNLQRQVLYEEADIGKAKALAAQEHLKKINSDAKVDAYAADLTFRNIESALKDADIILDGTDNLETRYLLNEYSLRHKKPWIYASAVEDRGFVMGFSGRSPCFQCVMKHAQGVGTCDTAGVINSVTALIGSIQTNECLKMILGDTLSSLFHVQLMGNNFDVLAVKKDPACRSCRGEYEYLEGRKGQEIIRFCRTGQFQIFSKDSLDLAALKKQLQQSGNVHDLGFCLVFKDMKIFRDRVLINAKTAEEAKSLYSRFIGN